MVSIQQRKLMPIALVGLSFALLAGCATSQLLPVQATASEFVVSAPRDAVFDAVIGVAHGLNLNIGVLEKSSGLVQFETAALSAMQLDSYCQYPWVNSSTGQGWDTFVNWNQRSIGAGAGAIQGSVSLTLLLSSAEGTSTRGSLRGNFTAASAQEVVQCQSLGVFESDFELQLRRQLEINEPLRGPSGQGHGDSA